MGKATFAVSVELLAETLHLPEGACVEAVFLEGLDQYNGRFHILVSAANLPEVPRGTRPPECSPSWRRHDGVISFESWGLRETSDESSHRLPDPA